MTTTTVPHEVAPWPVPHTRSEAAFDRASKSLPGGVAGQGRSALPHPLFMKSAAGAQITDVDGNTYTDFHCGFGSILLGHNDPRLRDTAVEMFTSGAVNTSTAHELEAELAERLIAAVPSAERVVFACTGSEVTYHAIRLARAQTGRRKIIKFEGHYHGWHNEVSWSVHFDPDNAGPADHPEPLPETAGLRDRDRDEVLICGYNDTATLTRLFAEHGDDIAAVIMEPIFHNGGVIVPDTAFLQAARDLTIRSGSVLIFDEIITGFRHALGGAQSLLGVTPDLTTLGKAIGNGVPISVLAGRRDLIEGLAPTGPAFFSGTFNGQMLGVALANRCVRVLEEESPHEHLFALGERLRAGFQEVIDNAGADAGVAHYGSVWSLYFTHEAPHNYRDIARFVSDKNDPIQVAYQRHMLSRGFYIHPHYMIRGYLTAAHTTADVDRAVEATGEFFAAHPELAR